MSDLKIRCEYKKLVPIKDLKSHPKNPNKHPKDQIKRLAQVIEYQGMRHPVVVSELSGFVVAGHGRLEALKTLGVKEAPVDYQEFQSEEQEYAFIVSDNAIAEWAELDLAQINIEVPELGPDFDLDNLGLKDFEIEPLDKLDPQSDEDDVPEEQEDPGIVLGDLYQLGEHRLLCGDATDVNHLDTLLGGARVDMVYTDPPYGMNAVSKSAVLKKNYGKDIAGDDNTDAAKEAFHASRGLASLEVWWGANYYASALPDESCWLVWDKNNGASDQMDCELAWTTFGGATRQWTKASEKTNRVHPTQKPVQLHEWVFDKKHPSTVLDLFGGSGSTLIACEKTKRKCYMMELEPKYCRVIIDRWEKYTGKKAEKINAS